MKRFNWDLVILCSLMAIVLLYFSEILFPISSKIYSFVGDFERYFYPNRSFSIQELTKGNLPLWNPYLGCGSPFLADIETAVFYPLNWLLIPLVSKNQLSYLILEIHLILHYFLAGLFMFYFLTHQRLMRVGAFIGAVSFMFSGFFWSHVSHVTVIEGAVWLPLTLLFFQMAMERQKAGYALMSGISLACSILAGHPQLPFFIIIILTYLGVYKIFFLINGSKERISLKQLSKFWMLTIVSAFGLAAVQLLPTLQLAKIINRMNPDFNFVADLSLHPRQFLSLLTPFFHNTANIDETHLYMGVLILFLSIFSFLHPNRKAVFFYVSIAVGSSILSLGLYTPLYHLLYEYVPGFKVFRVPARFIYLINFAIAVLAGFGIDALITFFKRDPNRKINWWLFGITGVMAVWVILHPVLMKYSLIANDHLSILGSKYIYVISSSSVLTLLIIMAFQKRWIGIRGLCGTLVILLMVELFTFNRTLPWGKEPPSSHWIPNSKISYLINHMNFLYRIKNEGALFNRGEWHEANASLLYKIPSVGIYSSLDLTGFYSGLSYKTPLKVFIESAEKNPQLMDLLNIKYIISSKNWAQSSLGKYNKFALLPGGKREMDLTGIYSRPTQEIELVSYLANSIEIPNNQKVAEILIWDQTGKITVLPVLAGRDTAEGAYDKPGLSDKIKHKRPPVESSWSQLNEEFKGHNYRARFYLPSPILPVRISISYLDPRGSLTIEKLMLQGVNLFTLGDRFIKVFDDIYENRYVLPKAFMVYNSIVGKKNISAQELEVMNPETEVLLEEAPLLKNSMSNQNLKDSVQIIKYTPEEVELKAGAKTDGFLVLGELDYPGWRAYVDGEKVKIYRANSVVKSIFLTKGEHSIMLKYKPRSFYLGLIISLFTLVIIIGYFIKSRL